MTRKQVEVLDRKTWRCLGCQEVEANPNMQATEDPDEESEIKIRKTKISTLKILQINIDFLLSKLEEFKMILKEEDIEIFLVQETKTILKDKVNIPGYTLRRKDRTQLVGNEENRGGGLLIGIRKDIPYKDVYEKVNTDLDKHTELNAVEIPMTPHHKLRLTNIYIPPDNPRCIDNEDATPWKTGNAKEMTSYLETSMPTLHYGTTAPMLPTEEGERLETGSPILAW